MRTNRAFSALCLVFFFCAATVSGQNDAKPAVSPDSFTSEQLAVYRAVLPGAIQSAQTDKGATPVNLADLTTSLASAAPTADAECGKGLDLEPQSSSVIHQIRPGDLALLGASNLRLLDPQRGAQEVKDNDPEKSLRRGSSVDDAVRNGFAHGLLTLSEIRFDKSHTHAIVAFSFVCGSLCGHGETLILKKTDSGWQRSGSCDTWISRAAPGSRYLAGKRAG
jgi:hypothetical protein